MTLLASISGAAAEAAFGGDGCNFGLTGTVFRSGDMGLDLAGEVLGGTRGESCGCCFTGSTFLSDIGKGFDAGLVGLCFVAGLAGGLGFGTSLAEFGLGAGLGGL